MASTDSNPFSEHYKANPRHRELSRRNLEHEAQVLIAPDLDRGVKEWRKKGLVPIGTAEFVARGDAGVGENARAQAAVVGASVVLFRPLPAKLKSIRRKANGAIDLDPVLADPPAQQSPRSYYVINAVFLSRREYGDV